jgi:MSHA biogenesis protein MshQ
MKPSFRHTPRPIDHGDLWVASPVFGIRAIQILLIILTGTMPTESVQAAISYVNKATASSSSGTGTTASGSVSYRSSGNLNGADSGSTELKLPSSLSSNDLIICLVESRDNVTPSVSASGWTRLYSQSVGASQASLFYKWAVSGDSGANVSISHSSGGGIITKCSSFRGVNTTNPFDTSYGAASSSADSTVETGSIATGTSNRMLLFAAHMADDHNNMSITTGGGLSWSQSYYTKSGVGSGSTKGAALGLYYATQSPAASTGPLTATVSYSSSSTAAVSYGVLLALRPATSSSTSTGAGLTISTPSSTAAGDTMIASIAIRPYNVTINTPSGWTLVRSVQQTSSSSNKLATYRKQAVAGDLGGSHSWWFVGTHKGAVGSIATFSGVDPTTPVNAENGVATASSFTHATPSVTTTAANTMLVASFAFSSATSWSPPTGMLEAADVASRSTSTSGETLEVAYAAQAAAGASGAKSATAAGSGSTYMDRGVTHILALNPYIPPTLDHVRIEHDGAGVTCGREAVTVKTCANAACTSLYTSAVSMTLSPSLSSPQGWYTTSTGGSPSSSISVSGGSGIYYLSKTSAGTATLGASSISPATVGSTAVKCFIGPNQSCSLAFAGTGFTFGTIPNQSAGASSGSITLQAVTGGGGGTCTGITGTQTVDLAMQCLDPSSCAGKQVTVGGIAISSNPASAIANWTPVSLTFNGNSIASFNIAYPDVGSVQLSARYPSGSGSTAAGSSNTFVVKPSDITLTAIKRTSDNFANPGASDANGPAFQKTSDPFSVTITVVDSNGNATPNFGRESSPEGILFSQNLVAPIGGSAGTLDGSVLIDGSRFSSGTATVTDLSWDEVGIMTLTAAIGDSDYLGAGNVSKTSGNIGRFIPHHFSTDATPTCPSASEDPPLHFTYSGQAISEVTVSAKDASEDVTSNYDPTLGFAKAVTLSDAGDSSRLTNYSLTSEFINGVANTTTLTYTFPYNSQAVCPNYKDCDPRQLTLRATDDEATSASATEATPWIFSGRLSVSNATGSELLTLSVPLLAQYYNGATWVTNTEDVCTALTAADVSFSNYTSNLAAGQTTPTIANNPLSSGSAGLTLSAPGAGHTGSTTLTVTAPSYLQFDWNGDNSPENPSATAVFGNSTPTGITVIDTRESF